MCKYGLSKDFVSDNGTQFDNAMVIDVFWDLGVHTKFISVVHPQVNGQPETMNNVIQKGLKKKLDDAKGLWAKFLHEILWPYHITPQKKHQKIHLL